MQVTDFLIGLDAADKDEAKILDLLAAKSFITTQNANYDQIEAVAKEQGLPA